MKLIVKSSFLLILITACNVTTDSGIEPIETACCSDSKIHVNTADLWKHSWRTYFDEDQVHGTQIFKVSKEKLMALNPENDTSLGIRVYFGLHQDIRYMDNPFLPEYLSLNIALTDGECNDLYYENDSVLSIRDGGYENYIDTALARCHISRWYGHLQESSEAMLDVYAYNFNWGAISRLFPISCSEHIVFVPALHSVLIPDTNMYAVTPNPENCLANAKGYMVFDLIAEPEYLEIEGCPSYHGSVNCHLTDLANPCPQFCGTENLLSQQVMTCN